MQRITLIGSGLVGSLLSIYLARKGHKVEVFERRPDLRTNRISAGRSINLALSDRGWRGLDGVGISEEIRKVAIPMKGRMMHSVKGDLTYQAYGKENQAINSVSRGGLNCVLMDLAEKEGVKIHFEHRCTGLNMETANSTYESHGKMITNEADLIFATDGAFSSGRLQMMLGTDRFNYSQNYLEHGYKELTIPPVNGEFAMDPDCLHIWPRDSYMLIALPNMDRSFTCTLFFPFDGDPSFSSLDTPEKGVEFFKKVFPDTIPLMPDLYNEFKNNPAASLVTVRCTPWNYKDKLLLIGDAAHAIVPFYGQGMNCGFEDCVVLNELMEKHKDDWKTIFPEFSKLRKPDSDAIADLAINNFIEMRDRVGKQEFLLQKKIENWFSEKHPDKWTPLYTMVTFSPQTRYSIALQEGKKQEAIMQQILAMPGIEERWNSVETEERILQLLAATSPEVVNA
jgi:kynurenine 3-monooxygenase